MIRPSSLFAALVLALVPLAAAGQNKGLVVVLPLDAREAKIDRATLQTLEEAVRTVAGDELKTRGYTVLTGETTLSLLADNGVDPSKACEASCALETARQLKAELFISGSIATSEGEYVAFIRVFENKSGTQLASVQIEAERVKELRRVFAEKAPAFFARALGGAQPAPATVQAPVPVVPATAPAAAVRAPVSLTSPGEGQLLLQLASESMTGTTVSLVSTGEPLACRKALSFGIACRLQGVPTGEVQLDIRLPDAEPHRVKTQVGPQGSRKLLWAVPRAGGVALLATGLISLGLGAFAMNSESLGLGVAIPTFILGAIFVPAGIGFLAAFEPVRISELTNEMQIAPAPADD